MSDRHTHPHHSIRIPAELWERAGEIARANCTDRNAVIRQLLAEWCEKNKQNNS